MDLDGFIADNLAVNGLPTFECTETGEFRSSPYGAAMEGTIFVQDGPDGPIWTGDHVNLYLPGAVGEASYGYMGALLGLY